MSGGAMKEYEYSVDMPHSRERIWALMNDYDRWPEFAKPMVTGIRIAEPGDETGNGLVRHVGFRLPLGLKGTSIETVHDVEPGVGYTYTSATNTVGKIRLESLGPDSTRLHFHEEVRLGRLLSLLEGTLARFIAKFNRRTMVNMSEWLTAHPEYSPPSG
jgi:hypothetical protein